MKTNKNLPPQLKMLSNLFGCHGENEDMIINFKLKNKRKEAVVDRRRRQSSGRRRREEENKVTASSKFPTLVLILF